MSEKITYKDAGVNIEEGYKAVEQMKEHVKSTFNENVLTGIGSFGGLFQLPMKGMEEPVLVSGTDGVGTKLKIAFMTDIHDTVGQDLVAMCVNDVLCQGATPLFFLDYLATGALKAEKAAALVKGIADGCRLAGCALVGGETAEMPGFYADGEYDMAGFTVGMVDKKKIIDGSTIVEGDVIIGLPSSGIHSNGYSLVRKLIFDVAGLTLEDQLADTGMTVKEALITPTRIYVKPVLKVINTVTVKGAAHITGGGFIENIPRTLPAGVSAKIDRSSWEVPKLFKALKKYGNLEDTDMFNTFNMGVGFVLVIAKEDVEKTLKTLESEGVHGITLGSIVNGSEGVIL
ncbi:MULTISPECIES: phosphoribosylformylglycinamidine cyclo-ligase [unclassified Fusibacter]|uniref:phosphoribosylformylglycinamidine cyclo-ligase n=1 Tax=unclassified Fusibacter TaxID=2624464 RepID=UPI001011DA13|nr:MULTISPECIES: phosphoribosylformylglycinamidine cyclo-ligase [unclassified Fusibacter]MCK8059610.1 phosphoribosylformylglycinamidine cyclo-ligase [Fusibacter sp. A2]NPE21411.1 phosphoribosylformylglycinamidine cyclo-ligase [Fusibacter sp. A1]RXV61824.1 phosphoribosylformylglycinamidine cyclo-ligase [Fusibacter sp. A1]